MTYFPARVVVDLDAIAHNVRVLGSLAPTSAVMAVVKADAYGHGLVPVARAAQAGGATWLGTAQLDEALTLRAAGVNGRLLTWIFAPGAPLSKAIEADIDLSAGAAWALADIIEAARSTSIMARVHLKVDTGLGRGGAFLPEWTAMLHQALEAEAAGVIRVVGVWSHLASADDVTSPVTNAQLEVFTEAVARAEQAGADLEVRHLANSAATLINPAMHADLVRPGIAVYGLSPIPGRSSASFGLVPAMRLEASVMVAKQAGTGQGVSYGHTYTTTQATTLADIPLGYADGIPRHASGRGPVQIAGTRHHVAGRVCMDQFVVDVGPDSPVRAGDTAVLFGSGAGGEPTAADWAEAAGTIDYEIVTRIGARVPRSYVGTAGVTSPGDGAPHDANLR